MLTGSCLKQLTYLERYPMKLWSMVACVAALATVNWVVAAEPTKAVTHQTKQIEGWTVLISERLFEQDRAATDRALELLGVQLQEIVRVVPAVAVVELKKVPLWFSPEYPNVRPRAEYHPGAGWLRENKRDPIMEKAIEFTNIRIFERETKRMPNFALHELAHAFHDRVLARGFGNPDVKAAYESAKAKGLYDKVEQRFGDGRSAQVRAYAITNPMEYFAECSEAFFSTNDFFPFNREQLAKHDPAMIDVLKKLWSCAEERPAQANVSQKLGKYSGSLWLLTTSEGANLSAEAAVEDFPVLVRLHRDYFDFSQTRPDGADVRFTSSSGEPLAYQIEAWDAAQGLATLWVRVPKITGNSRQEIKLHWGNPQATNESNGQAVFNATNGFLSVWHMHDRVQDEVGTLTSVDKGTVPTTGVIGAARHLSGGQGVFGGDKIANYPSGASPHSTEAWFRPERPNSTPIAWGNEQAQGKVVMQYRSPPHVRMDCYFSQGNVSGSRQVPRGEWTHVVHTYQQGESKLYINGALDGTNMKQGPPLNIRSPARLWLGGWYNNYDFVGDLDEVRVSQVVRSADWIKLQYENQKPNQTLVGPVVQSGDAFSVLPAQLALKEGQSTTVTAKAPGAQKVYWILRRDGQESIVATDRFTYTAEAGRVDKTVSQTLTFKAIYADEVKSQDIAITISDELPEPVFTLAAPAAWDGRATIEIVPKLANLTALQAKGVGQLNHTWSVDDIAVIKQVVAGKLILKRAQGSGTLRVTAAIDNGGAPTVQSITIAVQEPSPSAADWTPRPVAAQEQPEDDQFIARDGDSGTGTLVYAGTLAESADSVFVRVYADDKLMATQTGTLTAAQGYSLAVKLPVALVKYRTEFGSKTGGRETVRHTASNLVCGDVYVINGQSNAVATDFGKENTLTPSEWVRTYGATSGNPQEARLKLWANAEARSPGGKAQIGYWGLELGRRLVESEKIPVCIINGAVGGTRIDQHQRNESDPTDVSTIYGRLLWRVQQARLTHGVRAVLWHQGENDQGADGPTGGFGYETYRAFFVDLAASWKQDYPNVQRYYAFQIWPRSCAMGINGSDNRLREVQRTLPRLFSNLSVMSTLGVKPPGGCHFPAAGYAEFARLIAPLVQQQVYQHDLPSMLSPANLQRAFYANADRDELVLEFDQAVAWSDPLVSQFYLDGEAKLVKSGAANGNRITLKLNGPSKAAKVTYLDSAAWSPDNLLYGINGIAALTFCDVPIQSATTRSP